MLSEDFGAQSAAFGIAFHQASHPPAPDFERLGPAEGNQHRSDLFRQGSYHRALRIACRASVRSSGIAEHGQVFQVEIKFSDALVGFPTAGDAKNNIALHFAQIVKADGQPAFPGDEINDVNNGIDAWEMFPTDDAAKQRLRGSAIARRVLAKSTITSAGGGNRRGLHTCARILIFQY